MATLVVCPRCKGSLPTAARSCPRCGLIIADSTQDNGSTWVPGDVLAWRGQAAGGVPAATEEGTEEYGPGAHIISGGTTAHAPSPRGSVRPAVTAGAHEQYKGSGATPVVPRGAIEMLPDESVAFQLGALYLTNKRVILLAPNVVRAAFLRDVDAVGTHTDRAPAWSLFFSIILLGLSAGAVYAYFDQASWAELLPWLYWVNPLIPAAVAALLAIFVGASYFLWTRRTLFVSVGGKPLITVSISEWNARKLAGVDAFVNAFFHLKHSQENERAQQ